MTERIFLLISLLAFVFCIPLESDAQTVPGEEDFQDHIGHVASTNELAALESVLHDYLNELKIEQDTTQKEYLELSITRLGIAKAMMQVSINSTDVAPKYQGLTILQLLDLLDETYGPNDYPATNSNYTVAHTHVNELNNKHTEAIYFVTHRNPQVDVLKSYNHIQKQYDCVDEKVIRGSALSVLTSYTDNTATITGTFNYPNDMDKNIKERRSLNCLSFEHVQSIKRHDVLISLNPNEKIVAEACTLRQTNPSGSDSVSCNAFGANRLTVITTINEYSSSEMSENTQLGSTLVTLLFTLP